MCNKEKCPNCDSENIEQWESDFSQGKAQLDGNIYPEFSYYYMCYNCGLEWFKTEHITITKKAKKNVK
jgi:hypothetical protein